jgi:uncharacterized protein YggL (DUF469 family)
LFDGDFSMSDNTEANAHNELVQKLIDAGFNTGWVLNGTELVIWEHEENPPKPLTRPK